MEPYAATAGIKNRVRQQMVQIDEHRAQHNDPSLPPILFPEHLPENKRHYQVKCVVDDMSKDVDNNFHNTSDSLTTSYNVQRESIVPAQQYCLLFSIYRMEHHGFSY